MYLGGRGDGSSGGTTGEVFLGQKTTQTDRINILKPAEPETQVLSHGNSDFDETNFVG